MGDDRRGPVGGMSERVCVVTGATSGIGFVTARELARQGATVVVVGHDPRRTLEATERIRREAGSAQVEGITADLSLQREIRTLSTRIQQTYPRVHVLVNNAGAVFAARELTTEGIERTWALNVLAPFLLSTLLLPRLQESAPARIVNVASAAHRGLRLNWDNLQGEQAYSGYRVYGRSKLALLLLTYEFARRTAGSGVTVNALHPGFVATRFAQNNRGAFARAFRILSGLFAIQPERGAQTAIYLASDPSVQSVTGQYFARRRPTTSSPASRDPSSANRLWLTVALQTGVPPTSPSAGAGQARTGANPTG
jgi:retinol dehydrogenase-12